MDKSAFRKELARDFHEIAVSSNKMVYKVFEDFCEMATCSFHNSLYSIDHLIFKEELSIYQAKYKHYEKRYLQIINEYKKLPDRQHFCRILGKLKAAMDELPFDYLGSLFHDLELHNKYKGQFFTPFHIAEFMAEIAIGDDLEEDIKANGWVKVCEPCCGAGAMLIAAATVFKKRLKRDDISGDIFFVGADIDPLCMRMTYIQMCLLEVSAQIRYENTLTQETFEVFDTPCLQVVNAFSKNAREVTEEKTEITLQKPNNTLAIAPQEISISQPIHPRQLSLGLG